MTTSATNQDHFLWAVGNRIQGLCGSPPPAPATGDPAVARGWFIVTGGTQPDAVNDWMAASALPGLRCALVPYTFNPAWGNAYAYMAALNAVITNLVNSVYDPTDPAWTKERYSAWTWFRDQPYADCTQCEIPVEVIGWVSKHLVIVVTQQQLGGGQYVEAKAGTKAGRTVKA